MRVRPLLLTAAFACVLATSVQADSVAGTNWDLSGTQTYRLGKKKLPASSFQDLLLSFDSQGGFALQLPSIGRVNGTYVAKGKRGFKATLDANALAYYQAFLAGIAKSQLQASDVAVKKFKVLVRGATSKDGASIKVLTKALMAGTATIDGRVRPGTVSDTTKSSGPHAGLGK